MKHTIIFDLDGTLLNTLEDLTDSVNYVMALHKLPGSGARHGGQWHLCINGTGNPRGPQLFCL